MESLFVFYGRMCAHRARFRPNLVSELSLKNTLSLSREKSSSLLFSLQIWTRFYARVTRYRASEKSFCALKNTKSVGKNIIETYQMVLWSRFWSQPRSFARFKRRFSDSNSTREEQREREKSVFERRILDDLGQPLWDDIFKRGQFFFERPRTLTETQ